MTTFHQLLIDSAEKYGSRTAVRFESEAFSYEELASRAEGVAVDFMSLGLSQGDHVAILMENSLECVLAWLASSVLGCTEVPINPQYRGDLLSYLLRDSETTAIICDSGFLEQALQVAPEVRSLRTILVNGRANAASFQNVQVFSFDFGAGESASAPMISNAPERVILYTSGTTGPSKGVTHTQQSCLTLSRYNAETLEYDETDRLLNFFPLFHQNARYTGVIPALIAGASIRLEPRLSTSAFWRTCDVGGITAFNYLGSVLRLILNVTPPDRVAGTHTIKKAFGAGAPPAVWEELETRLGIKLIETYGLSEAPMAALNVRQGERQSQIGSAGRASDLFEIAIVDEQDRPLAPGEVGEIVLRPKKPHAMTVGYYNKDAATVKAFRNLWFHSGDRGKISEAGDLFFEEREKDSIRRRGENISAWEVESVLDKHPDIAESAVYGVASEEADEDVAAAIILRRDNVDLGGVLKFAEDLLPRHAVPTLFRVLSDFPRTPTAKVQKAELRKAAREEYVTAKEIRNAAEQRS